MYRLFRLPAVLSEVGVARSTLHLLIEQGLFPPPVKLGIRSSAWPEYEVEALNIARINGKSDDEIRELVSKLVKRRTQLRSDALGGE